MKLQRAVLALTGVVCLGFGDTGSAQAHTTAQDVQTDTSALQEFVALLERIARVGDTNHHEDQSGLSQAAGRHRTAFRIGELEGPFPQETGLTHTLTRRSGVFEFGHRPAGPGLSPLLPHATSSPITFDQHGDSVATVPNGRPLILLLASNTQSQDSAGSLAHALLERSELADLDIDVLTVLPAGSSDPALLADNARRLGAQNPVIYGDVLAGTLTRARAMLDTSDLAAIVLDEAGQILHVAPSGTDADELLATVTRRR